MSDLKLGEIEQMRKLIQLKKENPEEYKEFLRDMKDVTVDIMTVMCEIMEEM